MRAYWFLGILLVITGLTGCSGAPSEASIRKTASASAMKAGGDELMAVENFHRINGFQKDEHPYVDDVHFDIVLKESVLDFVGRLEERAKSGDEGQGPTSNDMAHMGRAFTAVGLAFAFGHAKAGR